MELCEPHLQMAEGLNVADGPQKKAWYERCFCFQVSDSRKLAFEHLKPLSSRFFPDQTGSFDHRA